MMESFLTEKNLKKWLEENGEKSFRMRQIWQGVFVDLVESWEEILTLSLGLREKLREMPFPKMKVVKEEGDEKSQVRKVVFELEDGGKTEAVLLDHHGKRTTVCVSSMTGCPLGCKFCATGKLGAGRNLSADEMVAQVLHFERELKREGGKVTNVVVMGMGEPFLNLENVLEALWMMKNPRALNLAARHLTVSTAGIVPGILRFGKKEGQINLAVSLHAPNQELREKLMPVAKKWDLKKLMKSLDEYVEMTHRKVFYEYVMMKNVNDGMGEARELVKLLRGRLAHVNLIKYNAAAGNFEASGREAVKKFQEILEKGGVTSTVRVSLGGEVKGACGQLAGK